MNPLFSLFAPIFGTLIDRIFPDQNKANEAKIAMQQALNQAQAASDAASAARVESASKVIVAETSSGSWMGANWRPCLMFMFMGLLANQYFLSPILSSLGLHIVIPPLPPEAWNLLEIGVGGYVLGRSGEKITKSYSQAKFDNQKFFETLKKHYPQGLTQAQVDAENDAIKRATE